MTPLKSIRAKCLDCCCDQAKEVRYCTAKKCALFPYRMGHKPKGVSNFTLIIKTEKTEDTDGIFPIERSTAT